MSEDPDLFLGKNSQVTGRASGKWHLFNEKSSSVSICGSVSQSDLHRNLDLRTVSRDLDCILEEKGLGGLCLKCREWVEGSLSDEQLPKPGLGTDKRGTGKNMIEEFKRKVAEVDS